MELKGFQTTPAVPISSQWMLDGASRLAAWCPCQQTFVQHQNVWERYMIKCFTCHTCIMFINRRKHVYPNPRTWQPCEQPCHSFLESIALACVMLSKCYLGRISQSRTYLCPQTNRKSPNGIQGTQHLVNYLYKRSNSKTQKCHGIEQGCSPCYLTTFSIRVFYI